MDLYRRWACLFSAHGYGSIRPILQGPSGLIFILFNCPLHPFWSVFIWEKGANWGDGQIITSWRFNVHGLMAEISTWMVTGSMGWRLKCRVNGDKVYGMMVWKNRGRQVYKVLTSCPEAFMALDTCHLSVGFYLGSKRRFVFHALLL